MIKYPEIINVIDGSIAHEAGIEAGDRLVSINGHHIKDVFDYGYFCAAEELDVSVLKNDGTQLNISISKEQYEDLGIEFDTYLIDKEKGCRNKCLFCFIDQLPKGMRKSLYFKDDDSRLSYLTGNYVTLTNVDYDELNRIVKYRLSPINVSVHTTNPELRIKMLSNKFAGDIKDKLKVLVDGEIMVNCQIVLCKGYNDGDELDKTLKDLYDYGEYINSISIVPVGITKYREGLEALSPFDKEDCDAIIRQVEKWQNIFHEKYSHSVVYAADELYVKGEINEPDYDSYYDFPQLENGVGMMALLKQEVFDYLDGMNLNDIKYNKCSRTVSIATGVCAEKLIRYLVKKINDSFPGVIVNVYTIKNNFFGENVTVTGLLTGADIYEQLKDKDLGEALLISHDMVRSEEGIFLDDMTVCDLEKKLDIKIVTVYNTGESFVNSILGLNGGKVHG